MAGKFFMSKSLIGLLPFVLIALMSSTSWGVVSGKIIGVVKEVETGDLLPGANVYLKGTSIGDATGIDGHYEIPRVPPGAYTLIVSYIGFQEYSQEIKVQAGQTIELDVELAFKVVQGQAVTVTAQMKGQAYAINQQLTSNIFSILTSTTG